MLFLRANFFAIFSKYSPKLSLTLVKLQFHKVSFVCIVFLCAVVVLFIAQLHG